MCFRRRRRRSVGVPAGVGESLLRWEVTRLISPSRKLRRVGTPCAQPGTRVTPTELSSKLGTCAWLRHAEPQHPAPGGRAAVTWGPQGLGVLHSPCSRVQATGADRRSPAPLPGVEGQCASPGFPIFPAKSRGKARGRRSGQAASRGCVGCVSHAHGLTVQSSERL